MQPPPRTPSPPGLASAVVRPSDWLGLPDTRDRTWTRAPCQSPAGETGQGLTHPSWPVGQTVKDGKPGVLHCTKCSSGGCRGLQGTCKRREPFHAGWTGQATPQTPRGAGWEAWAVRWGRPCLLLCFGIHGGWSLIVPALRPAPGNLATSPSRGQMIQTIEGPTASLTGVYVLGWGRVWEPFPFQAGLCTLRLPPHTHCHLCRTEGVGQRREPAKTLPVALAAHPALYPESSVMLGSRSYCPHLEMWALGLRAWVTCPRPPL